VTDQTGITGVGAAMVTVADQSRAVEFYTEKLDFEIRIDMPYTDEERWIEVAPPGAKTTVALVLPGGPDPIEPGGYGQLIFATGDIEATHAELQERGVEVDQIFEPPGGAAPRMFFFRDADENRLLIIERD